MVRTTRRTPDWNHAAELLGKGLDTAAVARAVGCTRSRLERRLASDPLLRRLVEREQERRDPATAARLKRLRQRVLIMLEQRVGLETPTAVADLPEPPIVGKPRRKNARPAKNQPAIGDPSDVRVLLWLAGKMRVVTPESGVGADDALEEALAGLSKDERTTFDALGTRAAA